MSVNPEATDAQLAYLYTVLGYQGMPPRTSLRAARLIDELKNSEPATEKQLRLLDRLGWWGDQESLSKSRASELIEDLLSLEEQ